MAELAQPLVAASERGSHKLRRDVGPVGLVFASLGSIIGAGWLFGALYASSLAGPAAIIAWLLGGSAMMLLALTHAELGAAYPVAGGNARFPHYAFGRMIGFTSGWVAFLGAVTVGPIMVQATLLYTSNYISSLTTLSDGRPVLTAQGYVVAAALLLLFCTINVMGVRWLAETNKIAVCWKLFVPVLTVVALLVTSAHGANFSAGGGFMPSGWKGVFLALASGGVVFACLGFEQAVQLGGESRNPGRNIPLAIIGGMLVAVGLYIALQVAFIAALDPSSLSEGWSNVSFSGKAELFGPFAGLATGLGLGWLAVMLYTAAIVSPGGTGLLYTGASARLSFALGRGGYIPGAFARLTPRGTPLFAIAFSFLCGLVLFLPFPGWQQLVGFISAAAVIAYAMVPLSLGALRRQDPRRPRPFRLPLASLVAPAAFVVASEILLFTGWAVVWKLIAAILIGFALLTLSMLTDANARTLSLDWRSAVWFWPYLFGMGAISYLSSFDTRTPSSILLLGLHGPRNELTFGWDILAVALLSLTVYAFAIRSRLPAEQALDYVGDLTAEAEADNSQIESREGRRSVFELARLRLGSFCGIGSDEMEASMAGVEARSFDAPDETRTPDKTTLEIVRMGGTSASRMSLQPGWRWSDCIKPIVGGERCQMRHVGVLQSGTMRVAHEDGTDQEIGPGNAYVIEPGHDAWVVGDEPVVGFEFESRTVEEFGRAS